MRLVCVALLVLASCGRIGFDPVDDAVDGAPGVQRITAGSLFTCVIRSDHTTWCWGSSRYRELGRDSFVGQRFPVRVDALVGHELVSIAAGLGAVCAIDSTGTVWCWGDNVFGELGQGTTTSIPLPIAVTQLPHPARQIALGSRQACAVLDDASLWCWGDASSGQVGVNPMIGVAAPTQILTGVAQVTGGEYFTCALRLDRTVACWGTGIYGELGTTGGSHYDPQTIPGITAVSLEAGTFHVCALLDDGRYRCWGGNNDGELGDPTVTDVVNYVPRAPSAQSGFQMLAAATYFTCGIDATASVRCFGDSRWGQLGANDRQGAAIPTLNGVVDVIDLAAGSGHVCALHADDSVQCWGLGSSGQLGDGTFAELTPQKVPLPGLVAFVGVGETHVCAVLGGGGDVYCWGNNNSVQLGVDTGTPYESATPLLAITGAIDITAGREHSCATIGAGMSCWGLNTSGELGRGIITQYGMPGPVVGIATAPSVISAGLDSTCAVVANQLACWGNDAFGQLGDGGGANQPSPQTFVAGTFTAVATGEYYTCAIDSTNQLSCWGYNGFGEVGNGMTNQDMTSPAIVTGGATYNIVSTGRHTTCARTSTGTAQCWGLGTSGQIGDGGFTAGTGTPANVVSLTGIGPISSRGTTSCAVTATGIACWGANTVGVFGDGSTIGSLTPVSVAFPFVNIGVGVDFACGISTANELYCWGDNSYGQLGLGTYSRSLVPVTVQFP